jgi:hypothetical protein
MLILDKQRAIDRIVALTEARLLETAAPAAGRRGRGRVARYAPRPVLTDRAADGERAISGESRRPFPA